jgi:hypothetical protein
MIAIDTFMQPMPGFEDEAEENFIEFCSTTHPDIFEFLLDCVDQNLILNTLYWEPLDWRHPVHPWICSLTRYYSIDRAKAELFLEKFRDMSADFSLQQFWNQRKFVIAFDLTEVDFEQETPEYEVVNRATGALWDLEFPTLVGSREQYLTWQDLNNLEYRRSPSMVARAQALLDKFKS